MILKVYSSHNDFVIDGCFYDFKFLVSLGCRDGSWGTHPTASHNKQLHKHPLFLPHSCCNSWLLGHHQSLRSPSGPNTLRGSVDPGGNPGGHPHPVPPGIWPGSTNPIPGHISCSAQVWHILLCRWAHLSSAAGPHQSWPPAGNTGTTGSQHGTRG